jgi:hypothetical protein
MCSNLIRSPFADDVRQPTFVFKTTTQQGKGRRPAGCDGTVRLPVCTGCALSHMDRAPLCCCACCHLRNQNTPGKQTKSLSGVAD